MIKLESVTKSYPEFQMQIDLEAEAGELVSLLGPSGSGKTTALRLIAGFEHPDAGRVLIDGRDVTSLKPAARGIGYVFQDYTLFPHMSVGQNIAYGLRIRHVEAKAQSRRVAELLELMDLPGFEDRPIQNLSGGERQRVAIARALAVDPVLLLLDEPFSSIDEVLRSDLRREIVRLKKELGITVLFVTHSRQEALSISDRVAVLRAGTLIQYDSPAELYHHPVNEFVAGFVGETNYVEHEGERLLFRPEQLRLDVPSEGKASGIDAAKTDVPPSLPVTVDSREFHGATNLYTVIGDHGRRFTVSDARMFPDGVHLQLRFPSASPKKIIDDHTRE
ncbi:MAG: ABC transporter ATP-binding protein [Spirochaetales bacterium]